MLIGDTFVRRSGSDGYHLCIVVSDPLSNPKEVLVLNLTTLYGNSYDDHSCVFQADEHTWLRHETYVAYDMAEIFTNSYLDRLQSKVVKPADPFPMALLQRVHAGAAVTQNLELRYLQLLQDQGWI